MKRGEDLKRRLETLETLSDAVSAMKSLAAHHFRKSREGLSAARAYREGIEEVLAAMELPQPEANSSTSAVLLIASDLGLCDGYNTRLTQTAIDFIRHEDAQRLYCVGRRPLNGLKQAGLTVSRQYHAPSSIAGLTELLMQLGQDLLENYLEGIFDRLVFVSARFEGVGEFRPVVTSILPIQPVAKKISLKPSSYVSESHLLAVAIREYLYIRLFQTLLDSLASEHGARLIATQSAGEWLSSKTAATHRSLSSIRREATTQEVLEIASSVRVASQRDAD